MTLLTQRLRFIPWLPVYVAVYFLFLYLPILLLPVFSFNNAATTTFPLAGFTTKWYG
jgi:spermidine/putrescine transport system permease protein